MRRLLDQGSLFSWGEVGDGESAVPSDRCGIGTLVPGSTTPTLRRRPGSWRVVRPGPSEARLRGTRCHGI